MAFRSLATSSSGSAVATGTVNVPAGVTNGDPMVLVLNLATTGQTPAGLSGWTQITPSPLAASGTQTCVYTRIASSEPASYTATWVTAALYGMAIYAYDGALHAGFGAVVGAVDTTNNTTVSTPNLTTTVDGSIALSIVGIGSASTTLTAPGGYTNRGGVAGRRLQAADQAVALSGTVVSGAWTASANALGNGFQVEITAVLSGGTPVNAPTDLLTIAAVSEVPDVPFGLFALDEFDRTVANGWGAADVGGSYTADYSADMTTANISVSGGYGRMIIPTADDFGRMRLLSTLALEVDARMTVQSDKLAVGGSQSFSVIARRQNGSGSEYRAMVRFDTLQRVWLQARKLINIYDESAVSAEVMVAGLTVAVNTDINVRVQVVGSFPTTIRIRAWATLTPEPSTWDYVASDDEPVLQSAGILGLRGSLNELATNGPVELRFGSFLAMIAPGTEGVAPVPFLSPSVEVLGAFTQTVLPPEIPFSAPPIVNPFSGPFRWRTVETIPLPEQSLDEYERYTWNTLEPTLGVYDFSSILTDYNAALGRGHSFAFRVRSMTSPTSGLAFVPAYLAVKPYGFSSGGTWCPDFNNTYVQDRMDALLTALKNYMVTNSISPLYMDIGMVGQYGEWSMTEMNYADPDNTIGATNPVDTTYAPYNRIVDTYMALWPTTQLVMFAKRTNAVRLALDTYSEIGLRDDGYGSYKFIETLQGRHTAETAAVIKARCLVRPLVAEFYNQTDAIQDDPDFGFDQAIIDAATMNLAHFSNGNMNTWASYSPAHQQMALDLAKTVGYRYVLSSLTHPLEVVPSIPFDLTAIWQNRGTSQTHEPWAVCYQLRRYDGTLVWTSVSEVDLHGLPPTGDLPHHVHDSAVVYDDVEPQSYLLCVSVLDPRGLRRSMQLAMTGQTGTQPAVYYPVSTITVLAGLDPPIPLPVYSPNGVDLILDGVSFFTERGSLIRQYAGLFVPPTHARRSFTVTTLVETEDQRDWLDTVLQGFPVAVRLPDGTLVDQAIVSNESRPYIGDDPYMIDLTILEL